MFQVENVYQLDATAYGILIIFPKQMQNVIGEISAFRYIFFHHETFA